MSHLIVLEACDHGILAIEHGSSRRRVTRDVVERRVCNLGARGEVRLGISINV
jgi:hypothetical protein